MGLSATISHMQKVRTKVSGRVFNLQKGEIEAHLRSELPEPLRKHFVVVDGRRFPPKQVIEAVTQLDRADFTTFQARSILRRLGFVLGRVAPSPPGTSAGIEPDAAAADALRPHVGRWVAVRGREVLVAADSPEDVLSWLERHNLEADSLFRVPADAASDQARSA